MVIKKNVMEIKNGGGINSSTFWESKNQMDKDKNKETVTNMLNEKGATENTKEGIGMVFQKFYTNLFKTDEIGNTAIQREMEIMEDILFKSIKTIEKTRSGQISILLIILLQQIYSYLWSEQQTMGYKPIACCSDHRYE